MFSVGHSYCGWSDKRGSNSPAWLQHDFSVEQLHVFGRGRAESSGRVPNFWGGRYRGRWLRYHLWAGRYFSRFLELADGFMRLWVKLSEKSMYQTFACTVGSFSKTGDLFLSVFRYFKWKGIGVLATTERIWQLAMTGLIKVVFGERHRYSVSAHAQSWSCAGNRTGGV